jgi:hypothetical protein
MQGRRLKIANIGFGNFNLKNSLPIFKLRFGVEAKRAIEIMASLPSADSIMRSRDVSILFCALSLQAEHQAKVAYRNGYPLSDNGVQWVLLAGPYWMSKSFGPFSEAENAVCADISDFEATMDLLDRTQGPSGLDELYLLNTQESHTRLDELVASTDQLAEPLIQAMYSGTSLPSELVCNTVNRATIICITLLVPV